MACQCKTPRVVMVITWLSRHRETRAPEHGRGEHGRGSRPTWRGVVGVPRLGVGAPHALPSHVASVGKHTPIDAGRAIEADGTRLVGTEREPSLHAGGDAQTLVAGDGALLPAVGILFGFRVQGSGFHFSL